MATLIDDDSPPTFKWWESKRFKYNIGLVVAGVSAFVCYVIVMALLWDRIPNAEITIFTTLFQAMGYALMMGVANVCYFLGPLTEKLLRPRDVAAYRTKVYALGFWFSIALPFSVPVLLTYFVIFHPELYRE